MGLMQTFISASPKGLSSEFMLLQCDLQRETVWHYQCNAPVCLSPSATALPSAALVCALLFRGSLRELLHCFPGHLRFGQVSVVLFSRALMEWVTGLQLVVGYRSQSSKSNFSSCQLFFSLINSRFMGRQIPSFCISVRDRSSVWAQVWVSFSLDDLNCEHVWCCS